MTFSSQDVLEPCDLTFLRRVLEEVCAEKDLGLNRPEAQIVARDLVDWFLFGVRNPDDLKDMIEPLEMVRA